MKLNKFNLSLFLSTLLLFFISLGSTTTVFASENSNTAVVAKSPRSTCQMKNYLHMCVQKEG